MHARIEQRERSEMRDWNTQKTALAERLAAGSRYASGKTVALADLKAFLEAVLRPVMSANGREGLRAFVEKRTPDWSQSSSLI